MALAIGKPVYFVGYKSACSVFAHPEIVLCSMVQETLLHAIKHVRVGNWQLGS